MVHLYILTTLQQASVYCCKKCWSLTICLHFSNHKRSLQATEDLYEFSMEVPIEQEWYSSKSTLVILMFLSVESRVLLQLQQYNTLPLIVSELQSVLTWPSAWEHNSITPSMYYTRTAWGFLWNYIIWWQKWHILKQMPVTEFFRVQELITLRASPAKMIVPIFAILKLK